VIPTDSSRFTLRDVQYSISLFLGTETEDVKQLLTGAAKLYIKSTTGVKGWVELKKALEAKTCVRRRSIRFCDRDKSSQRRHASSIYTV